MGETSFLFYPLYLKFLISNQLLLLGLLSLILFEVSTIRRKYLQILEAINCIDLNV